MSKDTIILIPEFKPQKKVGVYRLDDSQRKKSGLIPNKVVYEDMKYQIDISCLLQNNINGQNDISGIEVFINEEKIPCLLKDNFIFFINSLGYENHIFKDIIGFVEISIVIYYSSDEIIEQWISEPLSVLVPKTYDYDQINRMVDYVYNNQSDLLINTHNRNYNKDNKGIYIDYSDKLSIAKNILKLYKNQFGFFKANARFKVEPIELIDDAKKVQILTGKSIQNMLEHPGVLRENFQMQGINIGSKYYLPEKLLMRKNVYTVDIYENQVIISFIRKIIMDLNQLQEDIENLLIESPWTFSSDRYIPSSLLLIEKTYSKLKSAAEEIPVLVSEYEKIYALYQKGLPATNYTMLQKPRPSAIFLSVPQYHEFYRQIIQWFDSEIYNLKKESFMLSIDDLPELYELYILSKLIDVTKEKGFSLIGQNKFSYHIMDNSRYCNTYCNNTFIFESRGETIVLYYQPVIFDGLNNQANGIGLCRNTSLTWEGDYIVGNQLKYYTPDYLIKYIHGTEEKYAVLDAKYSSHNSVNRYQVPPLAFKYITSLSGRIRESIVGLYIIYGKVNDNNRKESIYDRSLNKQSIKPHFYTIPIAENKNPDVHFQYLAGIIDDLRK